MLLLQQELSLGGAGGNPELEGVEELYQQHIGSLLNGGNYGLLKEEDIQ